MPQGRKLTHAERSLWEYVFGKALTEANVEVVRRPRTMHFGGFTPYCRVNMDGNAYQADYFRDDDMFRPRNAADAHHFLHELSHCWQHLVVWGCCISPDWRSGKGARFVRQTAWRAVRLA